MFLKPDNSKVHNMITEQIKDVEGCLKAYEKFLKAACKPETVTETLEALCDGVHQMENAADRSLRAMIDSLSDGAFLPATREDLIAIATSCDKVANKCEHTALQLNLEEFRFPVEYAKDLEAIMAATTEQFATLEKAIGMMFSNFGAMLKDHSILDEIRAGESKVDAIELSLLKTIYGKKELRLSERQQIAKFVEWICDISDIVEDIADKIQIMLITRKA